MAGRIGESSPEEVEARFTNMLRGCNRDWLHPLEEDRVRRFIGNNAISERYLDAIYDAVEQADVSDGVAKQIEGMIEKVKSMRGNL